MNKIICEVCGGSLVKTCGIFVCQDCGIGYSLQDVKNMMNGTGNEQTAIKSERTAIGNTEPRRKTDDLKNKYNAELTVLTAAYEDENIIDSLLEGTEGLEITAGTVKGYRGKSASVLITENDNINAISPRAFGNLNGLKNIVIYGEIEIGRCAFDGCNADILLVSGGRNVEENAFGNSAVRWILTDTMPNTVSFKENLSAVVLSDSDTKIGWNAFKDCSRLKSIVIPDSVTKIGKEAFCCCHQLESITILGPVTEIEDRTFYKCENLKSVVIPDSVTKIGREAFYGCRLGSINIPGSVTEIGEEAFLCSEFESVVIPDSVTRIGRGVFYGCAHLKSVVISDSVTEIGEEAFKHCSQLESVNIPDSVKKIGSCAFYGCENLKSVVIPDSVTEIAENAFGNYTNRG